jgi:hypothetical protein
LAAIAGDPLRGSAIRGPNRKAYGLRMTNDRSTQSSLSPDAVIADSVSTHAACWKQTFEEYHQMGGTERGKAFRPFDFATDYRIYVDEKSRFDGVRDSSRCASRCTGQVLCWLQRKDTMQSAIRRILSRFRSCGIQRRIQNALPPS